MYIFMEHVTTVKLFKNGNSQAVRLPKAFRFEGDEVVIYRQRGKVILAPKSGQWEDFFAAETKAESNFLVGRKDAPPQSRQIF